MSESEAVDTAAPRRPIERRLRSAGVLLLLGLLVEAGTLFALDRPMGFLTFAGAAGLLVTAGIVLYLWGVVSQGSATS